MTITAKIIKDSYYADGNRLTTFVLRYPRLIHAELMTHRVFSRNSASSRAIPSAKFRQMILDDLVIPLSWGKNRPGMQATEDLHPVKSFIAKMLWIGAGMSMVGVHWLLEKLGLHKQVANRLLEPWMHIEVVCTSSSWANFYALRDHDAAQPEIAALARAMYYAHTNTAPVLLHPGQWHLPFISVSDVTMSQSVRHKSDPFFLQKISTARCARVSYMKHDNTKPSIDDDLVLYDKLMDGTPKHASPSEHQARVPYSHEWESVFFLKRGLESNLQGWIQFRKLISGEYIKQYRDIVEL